MHEKLQSLVDAYLSGELLLMFDQDGSIAPFHSDPLKAYVDSDIMNALCYLEKICPHTVVFNTGRSYAEARMLQYNPEESFAYILQHGQIIYVDGQLIYEHEMYDDENNILSDARTNAQCLVRDLILEFSNLISSDSDDQSGIKISLNGAKGPLLEMTKPTSFAFHWRILKENLSKDNFNKVKIAFDEKMDAFQKAYIETNKNAFDTNNPNKQLFSLVPSHGNREFKLNPARINKGSNICKLLTHDNYKNKIVLVWSGDDYKFEKISDVYTQRGTDADAAEWLKRELSAKCKVINIQVGHPQLTDGPTRDKYPVENVVDEFYNNIGQFRDEFIVALANAVKAKLAEKKNCGEEASSGKKLKSYSDNVGTFNKTFCPT